MEIEFSDSYDMNEYSLIEVSQNVLEIINKEENILIKGTGKIK